MSRSESAADLSMEDILASIRSLVPADQRAELDSSRVPAAPPVPPTLNRVGERPNTPTLPLGTLPASRVPLPFEDDLADLLDVPEEPKGAVARPLPPSSSEREAEQMAPSPRPVNSNLDALFSRPAETGTVAVEPAEVAEPQAPERAAEPASQPSAVQASPPAPAAPSFMGLGQATGFFPASFSKRETGAPNEPTAPQAESGSGMRQASEQPAPAATIPPLRRSFFPASFHAQPAPTSAPVEPKLEMPPMPDRAPVAAPVPAPEVGDERSGAAQGGGDDRGGYSDALDQALRRLQNLGSLVPDQNPSGVAALGGAQPSSFHTREANPDPVPAEEVASPAAPVNAVEVEPVSADEVRVDEADLGPVEHVPPVTEPAPQPRVASHSGHSPVRLSDALWNKSAPAPATGHADAPATGESQEPGAGKHIDDALDVSEASPVVKAFGALALGLAQSGAQHHASAAPAPARSEPSSEPPAHRVLPETAKAPEPSEQLDFAPAPLLNPTPRVLPQPPIVDAVALTPVAEAAPAPAGNRSLEDMVADMLRPMLKQWLEDNMPRIVEKALRAETAAKRP